MKNLKKDLKNEFLKLTVNEAQLSEFEERLDGLREDGWNLDSFITSEFPNIAILKRKKEYEKV